VECHILTEDFTFAETENLLCGWVDVNKTAIGVDDDDSVRRKIEGGLDVI